MKYDASTHSLPSAMADAFPWIRHLTDEEVRAFTVELIGAPSDNAAEQIIEGWRATARIKADPEECRAVKRPVEGDFGPVEDVM